MATTLVIPFSPMFTMAAAVFMGNYWYFMVFNIFGVV